MIKKKENRHIKDQMDQITGYCSLDKIYLICFDFKGDCPSVLLKVSQF